MASLVLKLSVSLDGYIAPADRSSDGSAAGRDLAAAVTRLKEEHTERLFREPLTIKPVSATAFSRGAVDHVFTAHA